MSYNTVHLNFVWHSDPLAPVYSGPNLPQLSNYYQAMPLVSAGFAVAYLIAHSENGLFYTAAVLRWCHFRCCFFRSQVVMWTANRVVQIVVHDGVQHLPPYSALIRGQVPRLWRRRTPANIRSHYRWLLISNSRVDKLSSGDRNRCWMFNTISQVIDEW